MKAIIQTRYGSPDLLEYKEVAKPVPLENEVLVKIHAAAINSWDWDQVRGKPYITRLIGGLFKPKFKIPGLDIAGRVEAVGEKVQGLKTGDEVFGDISECGWGGFADYVCVPEAPLALKPPSMSFEEAAALPQAGVLALQGLRAYYDIKPGDRVLINGAGGGVGTIAIQLAKLAGAIVTAVDREDKLAFLQSLGADFVIDYQKENFTKNGKAYDLVLDVMAFHRPTDYRRALAPGGVFVMLGGSMGLLLPVLFWGLFSPLVGNKKLKILAHRPSRADLDVLKAYHSANKIKLVIDKYYELKEVPAALQYLGAGHVKGKLVIKVNK